MIKVLLLAGVATFGILAFRGGNSAAQRAFWKLSGLAVVIAAGLSVLFPDSLTGIARLVGVRRGADLLLYLLVVAFMIVVVLLFRKMTDLEQKYVHLLRRVALDEVRRHEHTTEVERRPE